MLYFYHSILYTIWPLTYVSNEHDINVFLFAPRIFYSNGFLFGDFFRGFFILLKDKFDDKVNKGHISLWSTPIIWLITLTTMPQDILNYFDENTLIIIFNDNTSNYFMLWHSRREFEYELVHYYNKNLNYIIFQFSYKV